jgi:hypothetical protein
MWLCFFGTDHGPLFSHFYYNGQVEVARDLLLLSFWRRRQINRDEFVNQTNLSIELTDQLLEELAVCISMHSMCNFQPVLNLICVFECEVNWSY